MRSNPLLCFPAAAVLVALLTVLPAPRPALAHDRAPSPAAERIFRKALSLADAGKHAQARRQLRFLTQRHPSFAKAWVLDGAMAQAEGNVVAARAAYERYLSMAPEGEHAGELRMVVASLPSRAEGVIASSH